MLAYFLLGFLYFSSRTQDTFTFTTTPRGVGSPRAAPLDGASNTVVFEVPSFEILSIGQARAGSGSWAAAPGFSHL